MNMDIISAGYQNVPDMAKRDLRKTENKGASRTGNREDIRNKTSEVTKSNESKLSSRAQDFLKNLRKQYGDYDFFVGNSTDDLKSLAKSGSKEFSVIFSDAELERMASDEKYAEEKMQTVQGAVRMSREINRKYGFESALGEDTKITGIGIAFDDDGTATFFADLEKSSTKQRERIEKAREEKRAGQKAEEKKAQKELQSYSRSGGDTKRTTVRADSMEALFEKIAAIDWDAVKAENRSQSGRKIDFSI